MTKHYIQYFTGNLSITMKGDRTLSSRGEKLEYIYIGKRSCHIDSCCHAYGTNKEVPYLLETHFFSSGSKGVLGVFYI